MAQATKSPFLTLPPEIRESIYRLILNPDANRHSQPDEYTDYDYKPALVLFKLNHQIYLESRKIFRDLNIFVRIETPWPTAQLHVSDEGHVPVLVTGERAAAFENHSMSVVIDSPQSPRQDIMPHTFIILVDDLEAFCRTWYYADVTHPGLNKFLRLSLIIRDPYTPDFEEKRMHKWLQRKLLLSFSAVKDLRELVVSGDPKPLASVVTELEEEQKVPHKSPEHCLREATRLKLEGNTELAAGRLHAALKKYEQAWEAIHIVIRGRKRHVHADIFYSRNLHEPPFQGKDGQRERLILRVHLVANTCQVYLKLKDWEAVTFWAMRTINTLREAMGTDNMPGISAEDEAVLGFPGADQMGKIYYRCALAYKELGDRSEARRLLRVATVYLPRDESVKKEVAACALRLG